MITVEHLAQGPEPKLELIGGRLICGTLEASRHVLWMLLESHGPSAALSMARRELWLRALQLAFAPDPPPLSSSAWLAWAERLAYTPAIPTGGGRPAWPHWRLQQALSMGLYTEADGLGRVLGRDFVTRLGDDGFTPDVMFVRREHLARLRQMYLDGPADLVIEIVWPASAGQDRAVKRRAYATGGVPEYWVLDPYEGTAEFLTLEADGRYREARPDAAGFYFYRAVAVPELVLDTRALWQDYRAMQGKPFLSPFRPAPGVSPHPEGPESEPPVDELYEALPFRPRVDLSPVAISFPEYIAWCPEAKFELIDGKLEISGPEGSSHVLGLLLMSLGLEEAVRLLHPARWLTALFRIE